MEEKTETFADYAYWLHVRVWTANEAAALLCGFEPEYTRYTYHGPLDDELEDKVRATFSDQVKRLEKILESAQLAGELGKVQLNQVGKPWGNTVTWRDWIKWALKNNIPLVPDLSKGIDDHDRRIEENEPSEEINPRREITLLRTIGALLHVSKQDPLRSDAEVIREISDLFGHVPGIAKSTMERDFADAKRRLSDY